MGTVALRLRHRRSLADMLMQNPGDREWSDKLQNDELLAPDIIHLCYQPLDAVSKKDKIFEGLASLLIKHPIKPLTTVQSSGQDWFFLRLYGTFIEICRQGL
jgi:hypothetical protein